MKQLSQQSCRASILVFIGEQNQAIVPLLQHVPGLFQRMGMVEFRRQSFSVAAQDILDEEKVFLLVPYEQNAQQGRARRKFCR